MALIFQVWVNASVLGGSWKKTLSSETRVNVDVAYVRTLCTLSYNWCKLETSNGTSSPCSRCVIPFLSMFTNQVSDECSCGSRDIHEGREGGVVTWRLVISWWLSRIVIEKIKNTEQQLYKMLLFCVFTLSHHIQEWWTSIFSLYCFMYCYLREATRRNKIISYV